MHKFDVRPHGGALGELAPALGALERFLTGVGADVVGQDALSINVDLSLCLRLFVRC